MLSYLSIYHIYVYNTLLKTSPHTVFSKKTKKPKRSCYYSTRVTSILNKDIEGRLIQRNGDIKGRLIKSNENVLRIIKSNGNVLRTTKNHKEIVVQSIK